MPTALESRSRLNDGFNVTSKAILLSILWALTGFAFGQNLAPKACSLVPGSNVCTDATPCKPVSGFNVCLSSASTKPLGALTVPQTCWQWANSFICDSASSLNTVASYESNPKCQLLNSVCDNTLPENGRCTEYKYTYQCETSPAQTEKQNVCTNGLFNSSALTSPAPKSDTFGKAATALEIARQIQTYQRDGKEIFSGVSETCSMGYLGLKNCCKSTPGAKSNANLVASAAAQSAVGVVKYAGAKVIDTASNYAFDALYTNGTWTAGLVSAFTTIDLTAEASMATNLSAGGLSVGAYGFTWSTAAVVPSQTLMGAGFKVGEFAGGNLAFNPYAFAAVVAIQVLQNLMSCSQTEQLLALHRGANLSVEEETWCSNKVLLVGCIEWTRRYCSFNSVISKIINTQGKPQLGLDTKNCGGLTIDQVQQLDFSKIDMTEFTQSLVQRAIDNTPTNMNGNYTPIVQKITHGSSQSPPSLVIPTYKP